VYHCLELSGTGRGRSELAVPGRAPGLVRAPPAQGVKKTRHPKKPDHRRAEQRPRRRRIPAGGFCPRSVRPVFMGAHFGLLPRTGQQLARYWAQGGTVPPRRTWFHGPGRGRGSVQPAAPNPADECPDSLGLDLGPVRVSQGGTLFPARGAGNWGLRVDERRFPPETAGRPPTPRARGKVRDLLETEARWSWTGKRVVSTKPRGRLLRPPGAPTQGGQGGHKR